MRSERGSKKIIIGILVAALLIGGFGLGLHLIEKRGLNDEQFGDTGDWGSDEEDEELLITLDDTEYVTHDDVDTYLVIGTDAGNENQGEAYSGQLADFLTLLIVDNTTQKYGFVEIDRNSMVDVQVLDDNGEFSAYYNEQICLSRWYGVDEEQRNLNTLAAVSALFGYMDVDNYYAINMADMSAVNDAIGGVTVTIDQDMTSIDPAFVSGATVHLTNDQAEKFLRARMDVGEGTNKERMSRQRQYMQNAYNQVMTQLKENPEYISDMYDSLSGKIEAGEADSNLSVMTNQLIQYESFGIMSIDGKTKMGDTQGDGKEHEEFYADNDSIVAILSSIMDLTSRPIEYDDEDEGEVEDDLEDVVVEETTEEAEEG